MIATRADRDVMACSTQALVSRIRSAVENIEHLRKRTGYSLKVIPAGSVVIGVPSAARFDTELRIQLANERAALRRLISQGTASQHRDALRKAGVDPLALWENLTVFADWEALSRNAGVQEALGECSRDGALLARPHWRADSLVPLLQGLEETLASEGAKHHSNAKSASSNPHPQAVKVADWRIIQKKLLEKRERDEPYTSTRALADELGCSLSTLNKAMKKQSNRSDETPSTLAGWQARHRPKKAPPAQTLSDATVAKIAQTTEAAPVPVDAIMSEQIELAGPEERAKLNAMSEAQRHELASLIWAQKADAEPSALDVSRARVKAHKKT